MKLNKEIKTVKSVIKASEQVYKNINNNKIYTLKIICYSQDNVQFKYYFEIDKEGNPIYKRGLNTNNPNLTHEALYNVIVHYLIKNTYQFSSINDSVDNGIFRIYFSNNFNIEIKYNNSIDKLFFENIFNNVKSDIIDMKNKYMIKKYVRG